MAVNLRKGKHDFIVVSVIKLRNNMTSKENKWTKSPLKTKYRFLEMHLINVIR